MFQFLPSLIIYRIADYLRCSQHSRKPLVYTNHSQNYQLYSLLGVCRSWREIVLSMLYRKCIITLRHPRSSSIEYPLSTAYFDTHLSADYKSHVNAISMYLDYNTLLSGAALNWLKSMAKQHKFDRGYTLKIVFERNTALTETTDIAGSLMEFARLLRLLLPAICRTDVTFTHVHEGFADNWLEYSKFIQTVQQGATESRLFIPSRSLPKQPVMSTNITNLVRLTCSWDDRYKSIVPIIHASHKTLATLSVLCYHSKDFSRLVIADSGQPLIYPYLRSLNLLNYLTEKLEQVDVDHPGPFPKLRMLNLNIENPFSAPILFKGNSQTLAHLEMHMCDRTISPLIKSKVLDHANMKALERLILRGTVNSYRELDTDEHKLAGFILSMKRIKELLIMDARVCSSLLTMLETQPFKYLTKIRILDCPLTLIGAVKAIHQMPMLRELGCKIHAAGNEFQQMTPQDMLAFLATYCRPLNNNLYEWHVTNEQFESLDHAVMFILFIANACARLELIRLSITHAQWETLSRAVLNSSIYKRYQLKLEAVFVNAFDFYWRIEH